MKLVVLESPYAGDIARNIQYAKECVKHSLDKGEAVIASHLLYTQEGILNDDDKEEREKGIKAGLEWLRVADLQVFYIDYGITQGMQYGMNYAKKYNIPHEIRKIYK